MRRVFGVTCAISVVLFFSGCTQPPQIPELPNSSSDQKTEIALRDSLTAEDARLIFKALNQNGQLNGLKPFIENASDEELKILGTAANRYLYQEALDSSSLPNLIETRVFQKSFSSVAKNLSDLSKKHPEVKYPELLKAVLSHPSLPKLLKRNAYLFNPEWIEEVEKLQLPIDSISTTLIENPNLLKDISKMVNEPNFEKELVALNASLKKTELGKNFLFTLRQVRDENGAMAFDSLSEGFKNSLIADEKGQSVLSRFLTLAQSLNQPSQGLFTEAQATLKTEEGQSLVRLLSERFEPWILKGVTGYIGETLKETFDEVDLDNNFWLQLPRKLPSDPPTANLIHLSRRLQYALDKMANSARPNKNSNVVLNTFVLTEWFEHFAKENSDTFKTLPKEGFKEFFWNSKVKPFSFSLNLIELDDKGKPKKDSDQQLILSAKIESELKAFGLDDFASELKLSIKQSSFGPTLFKVSADSDLMTVKTALNQSVGLLHQAHPFADPVPLITSLAFLITRSENTNSLSLSDLETPNMLSSIQNFLKGLSYSNIHKLITFFFDELSLGNLSAEDIERLKSLYPNNPASAQLLETVLENIKVIQELDKIPVEGSRESNMSLLMFYHTFLTNSRNRDIQGLNSLFSFLLNTHLFEVTQSGPTYSSVHKALNASEFISALLDKLSSSSRNQEEAILLFLNSVSGSQEKEVSETIYFLKEAVLKNSSSLISLAQTQSKESFNLSLTTSEKKWIFELLSSDDFLPLYQVLLRINESKNLFQLASELERLEQQGTLSDLIKILGNFKSDRMQRLALVLWNWEKSKELNVFFSLIKTLTRG